MRGLKSFIEFPKNKYRLVAPHVGAWIEIFGHPIKSIVPYVAPHVGAWIEILIMNAMSVRILVAPHVGAWIEILPRSVLTQHKKRRTSRRCVD